MITASDLADWWEEQRRISTEWSRRGLDEFVEENPGTVSVMVATAAQTLVEFPMVAGSGVVDTLNLGKGAAEGGWGWAQDGLRLLSAVAPLARGGRTILSRVVAITDGNLENCTWMAAVKALRETGTKHFGVLEDLLKAAGKGTAAETGAAWVSEVTPFLKKLGARVRDLPDPSTLDDVIKAAEAAPDGVVLFSVGWAKTGHTLLAQYHPLQGVLIADRSGVLVKSLAELVGKYGPGIATAKPYGSMALVEAAQLIKGLNLSGLASMLGLEMVAVFSPEVKRRELQQREQLPDEAAGRDTIGLDSQAPAPKEDSVSQDISPGGSEKNPPGTGVSKGGMTGIHPEPEGRSFPASPTINGKGKNTLRMELIPLACWKLNSVRFSFESSFVLPETREEFLEFAQLRKAHPGAPLSVFGHADPVGNDSFNKKLSGHRADSIYAVLTRDTARWEKLYLAAGESEGWGVGSVQQMLAALGYEVGPATGSMNPQTRRAVEDFQGKSDLREDGISGPKTRAKLFADYMDFLCPDRVSKTEFLAQGTDAGGKGDVQGCGEFNPVMVFSEAESEIFSKPENKSIRDAENEVNRRVLVLLFRPGTTVPPGKWPCPRTSEGVAGCSKRFWSDGDKRRSPQAARKEFGQSQDTFACRFYQRLVTDSPCEGVGGIPRLPEIFVLDLHVKPDSRYIVESTYSMLNEDGTLHQRMSAADDSLRGDDRLTICYTGLNRGNRYSLEVEYGGGGKCFLFYKVPLERLLSVAENPEGTDESGGDQEYPTRYDELVTDDTIPDVLIEVLRPKPATYLVSSQYEESSEASTAGQGANTLIV